MYSNYTGSYIDARELDEVNSDLNKKIRKAKYQEFLRNVRNNLIRIDEYMTNANAVRINDKWIYFTSENNWWQFSKGVIEKNEPCLVIQGVKDGKD